MTIGVQTPGSPTTVTPDVQPVSRMASVQGPAPDGPIAASDVLACLDVALRVQTMLDQSDRAPVLQGTASTMVALTGRQTGDYFEVNEQGRYRFQSGSSATMGAPWHYASTGTPGGLWRSDALSMVLPQNQGLARIGPLVGIDDVTPAGRLPRTNLSGWQMSIGDIVGAARLQHTVAATDTWFAPDHYALISNLAVGDLVVGSLDRVMLYSTTANSSGKIAIYLESDVGGTPEVQAIAVEDVLPTSTWIVGGATIIQFVSMSFAGAITRAGNALIRLQVIAPSDQEVQVYGSDGTQFKIGTYQVFRP